MKGKRAIERWRETGVRGKNREKEELEKERGALIALGATERATDFVSEQGREREKEER